MGLSRHVDRHVSKRSCGPTCRRETFASQKGCRSWTRGAHWLLGCLNLFPGLVGCGKDEVRCCSSCGYYVFHQAHRLSKWQAIVYTEPNSGWIFLTPLSSTRFARKSRSATGRMLGQVSLLRVNSEPNLGASWDAQGMIRTPMVCNRNPLSMVRQIADLKRLWCWSRSIWRDLQKDDFSQTWDCNCHKMEDWVLLPTGHSMSSGIILKSASSFQRRSDTRWKRRSNSRGYRLGRSSVKLRKAKIQIQV